MRESSGLVNHDKLEYAAIFYSSMPAQYEASRPEK